MAAGLDPACPLDLVILDGSFLTREALALVPRSRAAFAHDGLVLEL